MTTFTDLDLRVGSEKLTISECEIDFGNINLDEQEETLEELLTTTPDKNLAKVLKEHMSSELCDMLKEHFMELYELVEAEEEESNG